MESRHAEPVEEVGAAVGGENAADIGADESDGGSTPQETAADSVLHEEFEAQAAELLAAAAADQGYQVEWLMPHLIIVSSKEQRIAFRGFAGGSISRALIVLTEQAWAARRLLLSRNVPVLPSMALDFSSMSYAKTTARKVGYPVTLQAVDEAIEKVRVEDEAGFSAAFDNLRSAVSERKTQLLIERSYSGEIVVAAVAGRNIVTDARSGAGGEVNSLPAKALEALPAAPYGSVRLVSPDGDGTGDSELVVESIDPFFRHWMGDAEQASRIAHEVLRYEFASLR